MTLAQKKRAYIGKSAVFSGYDGKFYDAVITEVYPRGISVEYSVVTPDYRTRRVTAQLTTPQAQERIVVQG